MTPSESSSQHAPQRSEHKLGPVKAPAQGSLCSSLPETALPPIPMPVEFQRFVHEANVENNVKTILPSFFNPIFRRQGVVNKHILRALDGMGSSLAALVREVESRDRVLETLGNQLNKYGEFAQGQQSTVEILAQQLAGRITDVSETARIRLESESQGVRIRTEALVATFRAMAAQIKELNRIGDETTRRFRELHDAAADQDLRMEDYNSQMVQTDERLTAELSALHREIVDLKTSTESAMACIREDISNQLVGFRNEVAVKLADSETRAQDLYTKLHDAISEEVSRRSELQGNINALLKKQAVLEACHDKWAGEAAKERQSASEREEVILSSMRGAIVNQSKLELDLESLGKHLYSLAEHHEITEKRLESVSASINGVSSLFDDILPALRTHLEHLRRSTSKASFSSDAGEAIKQIDAARTADTDGFYVALEARFRGSHSLIRDRQSQHLSIIKKAKARVDHFPPPSSKPSGADTGGLSLESGVLDLGCGRGEWLDLLHENDIQALGVDQNQYFLKSCRERGRHVVDADLVHFLRGIPDQSVAAVTCFHVIEHLPPPVFRDVARHVFRILRRGGAAIFETPNPGNILTSSLNFLLDPTHIKPVHPEFGRFVLETSGFAPVQLLFLSPYDDSHRVGDPEDPLARRFNEHFYGPQDYAIIGQKP